MNADLSLIVIWCDARWDQAENMLANLSTVQFVPVNTDLKGKKITFPA